MKYSKSFIVVIAILSLSGCDLFTSIFPDKIVGTWKAEYGRITDPTNLNFGLVVYFTAPSLFQFDFYADHSIKITNKIDPANPHMFDGTWSKEDSSYKIESIGTGETTFTFSVTIDDKKNELYFSFDTAYVIVLKKID